MRNLNHLSEVFHSYDTYVIDLFNCKIDNKNDFYKYKNAFHEFKPKLKNYEFLIPKKDFLVTNIELKN